MAYTGAEYSLGFVEGFNRRRREQKAEKTAAEDRARKIKREDADESFRSEQRDRQRKAWQEEDAEAPMRAEQRKQDLAKLRAKAEREGGLEFLYELDGGDIGAAVRRYNERGTSKIDPRSVRVNGRNITFTHSDTDGDGKPETVSGNLDDMIASSERVLGREPKKRYTTVAPGAGVLDEREGRIIATQPKPQTPKRPIAVGPNTQLLDPDTRQPIPIPGRKSGKGSSGTRGVSKFNPERYNADVQGELARLVGGSYDQATLRFDYGQASKKMPPFTRAALDEAARLNRTMPGEIPAQLIAAIVAEEVNAFDEERIREGARTRALANGKVQTVDGGWFGLDKPDPKALKLLEDEAVKAELQNTVGRIRTIIAYEEQKARAALHARDQEAVDATTNEEPVDDTASMEEEPPPNPEDEMPAINWPSDAPPRKLFGKGRPGTRLKANGQLWIIKPDYTPQRVQ